MDKGNYQQIFDRIDYLITHPQQKEQLGINGRKNVEEKFRNEVIWEHLETIYKNKLPV